MSWSRADLADAFSDVGIWQPLVADVAFNASGRILARGRVRAQDRLYLEGQIQATDYVLRFVTDELPGLNVDDVVDQAGVQYKVLAPPELSGSSGWFSTARVERIGRVYPKRAIDMGDTISVPPIFVGDMLTRIAQQTLGGHRIVYSVDQSYVNLADNRVAEHGAALLGFTTGAAIADAQVAIQNEGELEFSGWSWTPLQPIWVGENGMPTQTPPGDTAAFDARVAFAVSPTRIFIEIEEAVYN